MKKNHKFFSNLAFNLAEINLGKTSSNPSVGCIVVKNNSVISSGVTCKNGRPHAEFNALNKSLNFKNSVIYSTLEPCTHYGGTPPCTKIIKSKKISKVFYCFDDPDYRTYKKAGSDLKKSKIILKKIKSYKKDFYRSYYLNKLKEMPLLDAKIAISKDNYTVNKRSKWITNARSRKVAHLIRSKYDSIISTSKSINKDNSILNCRINGLNNNKPDLIIIDRSLKLKKNIKLLKIAYKRKTYIFTCSKDKNKISFFKKKGIKIIKIKELIEEKDFFLLIKKIFKLGKTRILVESGLIFLEKLLKYNLINQLYVFKTNKLLRKNGFKKIKQFYIKKCKSKNRINVNLDRDELFSIKI